MKQRVYTFIIMLTAMLCASMAVPVLAQEQGKGTATVNDPFLISDAGGLINMKSNLGKYYKLGHNIPAQRLKVSDPTLGISDRLVPGSMALIQGMRLSLKGDDAAVGITFYKVTAGVAAASGTRILPAKVYPNTPSKLQFTLPAEVVEGDWAVEVTTQASSNSASLLKTPRSYRYPKTVKVDDGADRPEIV